MVIFLLRRTFIAFERVSSAEPNDGDRQRGDRKALMSSKIISADLFSLMTDSGVSPPNVLPSDYDDDNNTRRRLTH